MKHPIFCIILYALVAISGSLMAAEKDRFPMTIQPDDNDRYVITGIVTTPSPDRRWQVISCGTYYYELSDDGWTPHPSENFYSVVYPGNVQPRGEDLVGSGHLAPLKTFEGGMVPAKILWSKDSKYCLLDICAKPYSSGELEIYSSSDWTEIPFILQDVIGNKIEATQDGNFKVLAFESMDVWMGDDISPDSSEWITLDPQQLLACDGHYLSPNWKDGGESSHVAIPKRDE